MNNPEKTSKLTVFYNSTEIARRVETLAEEISWHIKLEKIENDDLIILSLLKGSFIFTADLIRELYKYDVHPRLDFLAASSYGNNKVSSGNITLNSELIESVENKHVLIVDDILESGNTLHYVKNLLEERRAASIKIAVFLEKPGKLVKDVKADFIGFKVPDKFIIGYGLDYANKYRELPFIAVMED